MATVKKFDISVPDELEYTEEQEFAPYKVHFCHGLSSLCPMLLQAMDIIPFLQNQMFEAAQAAAEVGWKTGFNDKKRLAANGYIFHAMYRQLTEISNMQKEEHNKKILNDYAIVWRARSY